jgi:hypothetical protein
MLLKGVTGDRTVPYHNTVRSTFSTGPTTLLVPCTMLHKQTTIPKSLKNCAGGSQRRRNKPIPNRRSCSLKNFTKY